MEPFEATDVPLTTAHTNPPAASLASEPAGTPAAGAQDPGAPSPLAILDERVLAAFAYNTPLVI